MIEYARGEKTNYNFQNVLRTIWLHPDVSRIELTKQLDLDKATVSTIVNHLLSLNMVMEVPKDGPQPKPGRRPIGLRINGRLGVMVGLELHVDKLNYVVTDILHHEIMTGTIPTRMRPHAIEGLIHRALDQIKEQPELESMPILGIAASVPGLVDEDAGSIVYAPEIGIEGQPFCFTPLAEALHVPLLFANDANCCATGVLSGQRSEKIDNLLFVYMSMDSITVDDAREVDHLSVGLGMVIGGALYTGPQGIAGEFHTIETRPDRVGQFNLTYEELQRIKIDVEVQKKVYKELVEHVALIANAMNFQNVYVGGDLDVLQFDLKEPLYQAIQDNWPFGERDVDVRVLRDERMLPGRGAAGMLLDRLFSLPTFEHEGGLELWKNALKVVGG